MADVPIPTLNDKFVLVRTTASVISAGTEKTKIDMGQEEPASKGTGPDPIWFSRSFASFARKAWPRLSAR